MGFTKGDKEDEAVRKERTPGFVADGQLGRDWRLEQNDWSAGVTPLAPPHPVGCPHACNATAAWLKVTCCMNCTHALTLPRK